MDTAKVGLAVQIFPSSRISVNGSGMPATGELKVAMMFANGTDTVKNLQVGLQNTTVTTGTYGTIKLNNVNLGPIAWQLYILMNENLFIKNSIINEMGIAGPSTVVVDSSLFQLAVVASIGGSGCSLTISNSDIYNQAVYAANGSTTTLNNCNVYGSAIYTMDAQSQITINNGCFLENPTGCSFSNMVNITTGQPHCNPFIPVGLPQILTPANVTLTGVNNNCAAGIKPVFDRNKQIHAYPNPFVSETQIESDLLLKDATLTLYNSIGQLVKQIKNITGHKITLSRDKLTNGQYFFTLTENNLVISTQKLTIIN